MAIKIRKARISDVEAIQSLVNFFADRGDMLQRPLSEIYENLRDYYVAEADGQMVGCVALHINWSDLAEVKALAVQEAWQNQNAGRQLVEACLQEAEELGLSTVFALTMTPNFFERIGFTQGNLDDLPRKVWGECYRCPKFPKCDEVAMLYRIGVTVP